jgi:hypothetical protein
MMHTRQSRDGDDHNLVSVVMAELGLDVQSAMDWIGHHHDGLVDDFLEAVKLVPSFGDAKLDAEVATYVEGLAGWVRCNEAWSFEVCLFLYVVVPRLLIIVCQSGRYFGSKGLEIQKTRRVEILPKTAHWFNPETAPPASPAEPSASPVVSKRVDAWGFNWTVAIQVASCCAAFMSCYLS